MSKCDDLDPLLAPYVDGIAPAHDRAIVDAHLDRCPPCRGKVEDERVARDVLVARRAGLRPCASEDLRAKCAAHRAASRAAQAVRRPFHRMTTGWVPLSLAATLFLAVAGAFVLGLNNNVEALAAQVTLDHVKCFKFGVGASETSDPAVASREWQSAQGWALQVPASSAADRLELLCVRRCFVSEGRMAHIMYKWRGEPLSVFVVPDTVGEANGARALVSKFGHEAVIWSQDGRTYVVLSRGHPSDLEQVVSYVRANAR